MGSPRDLAFRRAEERGEELREAQYQQKRIVEDEVLEAERLIAERGFAVIATPRGPMRVEHVADFMMLQRGRPASGPAAPYVAPPDPKPLPPPPRAPRPPGPPRGPRREPRR